MLSMQCNNSHCPSDRLPRSDLLELLLHVKCMDIELPFVLEGVSKSRAISSITWPKVVVLAIFWLFVIKKALSLQHLQLLSADEVILWNEMMSSSSCLPVFLNVHLLSEWVTSAHGIQCVDLYCLVALLSIDARVYCSYADVPYVPPNGQQNGRGAGCILQYQEAGQEQSNNRYVGSFGSRSNYSSLHTVSNI